VDKSNRKYSESKGTSSKFWCGFIPGQDQNEAHGTTTKKVAKIIILKC